MVWKSPKVWVLHPFLDNILTIRHMLTEKRRQYTLAATADIPSLSAYRKVTFLRKF